MGMLNRRNAVLGWAAWQIFKRVATRKAKTAIPSVDRESKRPNRPAVVTAAALVAGALWIWWRAQDDPETTA